jgi:uncharacterized membrane protein
LLAVLLSLSVQRLVAFNPFSVTSIARVILQAVTWLSVSLGGIFLWTQVLTF